MTENKAVAIRPTDGVSGTDYAYEAYNPADGLAWESHGVVVGGATQEEAVEAASRFAAEAGMTFARPPMNAPTAITIADVRRLDIEPGDTLAIIADRDTSAQAWAKTIDTLKALHPDVHVAVFPYGTELAVIPAERVPANTAA